MAPPGLNNGIDENSIQKNLKTVELYSIVGVNPAMEIKKRFTQDTINRLLKLRWWDWPIEKITRNLKYLTDNNIEQLAPEISGFFERHCR